MRAAQVKEFGGPEVLVPVDLPDPVPGPGEVVIEVAYTDTIFVETQLRSGWGREFFPAEPPYVPGGGVSGVVGALGPDVPAEWLGRRVTSFVTGSYAERAVAAVSSLTPVPDALDLLTAAALVHDGVTATGLLELTTVTETDRVLILGASGGMGTLLVQLAHARGARVVGVARGEAKVALVRKLGADEVVDATLADWPSRARHALGGDGAADVVLDGVGGELGAAAFTLTADGGRFSAHGAPSGGFAALDPDEAGRRGITLFGIGDVQFGPADLSRLTAGALAEAAAGRLRPVVGEVFALEKAAEAHAAIEGRQSAGKVLLRR
ncbi:NADPH:quinone reductase [Streptomyces avermitilis]|uniref:Dehydrogenase n=2 Tax=Streptomyces avermitilis TaxID=33903 RepID=Q82G80_STRAW|nr:MULTISPECIES: zinc-binding dehydrogenase [Streptomyces]KUN50258.1 NADPH:quinone reductase [Streptomyces avermitilis]MYS99608.1 zinc-binding dehydrogenase [Streptomyces sp. SID5469]OOV32146.1 NADPH:quinone reductase [Streptomyces avermitilis]BAC71730.1 putative dehydrogenase [Streptomyces avermitilis MA-4680 = NBRC 14893]BBJ51978.1 NADPH:quinone reductase [Streptomyces avermitilis]